MEQFLPCIGAKIGEIQLKVLPPNPGCCHVAQYVYLYVAALAFLKFIYLSFLLKPCEATLFDVYVSFFITKSLVESS